MDNQNSVPNPTPTTENTPAQNSPVQETPPSQVYTAPQSSTPPPSPKSFLSSKILLLIVIVIIIMGAGGTYLALNAKNKPQSVASKTTPTSAPTPLPTEASAKAGTPDPTANWQTFTSGDNVFSFKYPSGWIYETKKTTLEVKGKKYDTTSIIAGIPLTEDQRKMQGYLNINDAPKTYNNFSLIYATSSDFNNLTVNNLVEELISTRAQIDYQKDVSLIASLQAKEVGYGCQASCIDILFKHDNAIFDSSTGPNAEANISTLRQILSTFQFTN